MNRRSRHLVVLALAVVTAAIASFSIYRAVKQMPVRRAAHVQVVVAARSMPLGTELTENDVKMISWPADSPVPGAISDTKAVLSHGLLAAVLENEPITTNKIAEGRAGVGLSPAIPQGMRAMSVKVNDVIGVAGFVVPGTKVDVVVTIRRQNDSMTRTAASNVQVLAAGTRQDQARTESDKKPANNASTVVTLMVSPEEAERIALAQSEGEIMLMLRNPLDDAPTATTGVKTAQLLGQPTAEPTPAVVKAAAPRRAPVAKVETPVVEPPKAQPHSVETFRGLKRTDEVIKDPAKTDAGKGEGK